MPLVERARWIAAALCAAWVVAFSWDEPRGVLVAVPLVLLGVSRFPHRVLIGATLVVATVPVTLVAGASWGNVDLVLPLAVALYTLGRSRQPWILGACAVLLAALGSAMREGLAPDKVAITLGLYGSTWVFGLVVRHRALRAREAVARAELLAEEDPAASAVRRAVEERGALANEALFALRNAIVRMRTLARDAEHSLDPALVHEVHVRGASAVDELRELLGLLREPASSEPQDPERGSPEPLVKGATVLRTASLGLAAVSLLITWHPPEVPELLLPVAAIYAVVTWLLAARPSRASWVCLVVLTASGVVLSLSYGPRGAGFVLFVVTIASLAGLAWGERDRILREAELRSGTLRARLEAASATAVRAERLRLARELHDVASHSVGAMVLHAGAASAQRERDPVRARAALHTVVSTAGEALGDVDEMLAALDAGAFGDTSRAYAGPGRLRAALEEHVATLRSGGMRVLADLSALPTGPALTATTFRVVHEGLANAARHAPGATVELTTAHSGGSYVVRVTDDGSGSSTTQGAGFGLAGLRERVLACDGTLEAGPGPEGGFVLEVRLPAETVLDEVPT